MKKFLSLLLAAMMVASLLTGCGDDTAADTNTDADAGNTETAQTNWNVSSTTGSGTELKFRTGGDQGTYYGFGSVLAQAITTNGNGTKVTAVVSNGSQDNIEQMDLNTAQLGFVQSDVMSYAYNGERLFEGYARHRFLHGGCPVYGAGPDRHLRSRHQDRGGPKGQDRFHRRLRLRRVLQRSGHPGCL